MPTHRRTALIALALTAVAGGIVLAGPLNPSAGPITPTFKTLSEVEPRTAISSLPFVINTAGSYYLTGNLSGAIGQDGITVNADDVTIDLNGFTISGAAGQGTAVRSLQHRNITVKNGSMKSWGGGGVNLLLCDQSRIESLRMRGCLNSAVFIGSGSIARDCVVLDSGTFTLGPTAMIERCSMSNVDGGLSGGNGSVIKDCAVSGCTTGLASIAGGEGSTITGCSVSGGDTQGINAGLGSTVSNCTVRGCPLSGFLLQGMCTVTNNTATAVGPGSQAAAFEINGSGNRIDGNLAVGSGYGFHANGTDNLIVRNAARNNTAGNYFFPNNEGAAVVASPGVNFTSTNAWANFSY